MATRKNRRVLTTGVAGCRGQVLTMTINSIRKRLRGGFVPFTIRTSDGEKFRVPHREFIYVTPRRVVIADRKGYVNVLDPLHIVSIEQSRPLPTR